MGKTSLSASQAAALRPAVNEALEEIDALLGLIEKDEARDAELAEEVKRIREKRPGDRGKKKAGPLVPTDEDCWIGHRKPWRVAAGKAAGLLRKAGLLAEAAAVRDFLSGLPDLKDVGLRLRELEPDETQAGWPPVYNVTSDAPRDAEKNGATAVRGVFGGVRDQAAGGCDATHAQALHLPAVLQVIQAFGRHVQDLKTKPEELGRHFGPLRQALQSLAEALPSDVAQVWIELQERVRSIRTCRTKTGKRNRRRDMLADLDKIQNWVKAHLDAAGPGGQSPQGVDAAKPRKGRKKPGPKGPRCDAEKDRKIFNGWQTWLQNGGARDIDAYAKEKHGATSWRELRAVRLAIGRENARRKRKGLNSRDKLPPRQ